MDNLATMQAHYAMLADIRNEYPQRYTQQGQERLCRLRDAIAQYTNTNPLDVQNMYCTYRMRNGLPVEMPPVSL